MNTSKKSEPSKGEVYKYRVSRRETEGTEIMKTRLGVVFSTNELNKQGKRLVIIPLTSKKTERVYNYEVKVLLNNIQGKALLDQIRTVNQTRLLERKGKLTEIEMKLIYEKFFLLFDIKDYL
jgi:mRNA interferase MazF